jgi:hypothetical protein
MIGTPAQKSCRSTDDNPHGEDETERNHYRPERNPNACD